MNHSRFAINHVMKNRMTETKIIQIEEEFSIPKSVGIKLPTMRELVSNPTGVTLAFHLAFLEIDARLSLQLYIRKVLWEIRIASAQLNLNA
ncbi:hypothetical protein Dsin_019094 [Dipteronia sinensis]|uniref:Uncharacterized protein n=1 Tax=Dipteronia sinensis TaxID=43782 RepID=A0AAE0E2I4_9ROSI|nr:hypothetical protein Dsin_019094 [Dipteronia sinensis]